MPRGVIAPRPVMTTLRIAFYDGFNDFLERKSTDAVWRRDFTKGTDQS
jgi:hypothetical protein